MCQNTDYARISDILDISDSHLLYIFFGRSVALSEG